MKSPTAVVACTIALACSWWLWPFAVEAAPPSVCDEGRVPVAWPLGETGFDTPRLLSSHGQYQKTETGSITVHNGVDAAACPGDIVYAVEDGVVEDVNFPLDLSYTEIRIADADEEDVGWIYQHVVEVLVTKGDTVKRNQALGVVADFSGHPGFDHVHMQRVSPSSAGGTLMGAVDDAGDPLLHFAARKDGVPPKALEFGSPIPATARFLFYEDDGTESSDDLALSEIVGKSVDVVARVQEVFPGPGPSVCSMSVCETVDIAHQLMPRRISFSILVDGFTESGAAVLLTKFHNVIDLTGPIYGDAGAKALVDNVYRSETVGYYDERKFLVVLTNCQEDGSGSFEFEAGTYTFQLVLEDASGNVEYLERMLTLH